MNTRILLLLATLWVSLAAAQPHQIQHLEPPHWWVGMKQPALQLMVHGERIAELVPRIRDPGVKLVSVEKTDNKNYLFINLLIARHARPGSFEISFERANRVVTKVSYRLEARRKNSADRRGFDARDAIYLITPDRFANGDPGNDSHADLIEKADRTKPGSRHGGDIKGMLDNLDYIGRMGFTMIWPMPLTENNQEQYSYHGYSLTDYYRIDRRFGSNQDYQAFAAAANAKGIGVIQDIVLNHIGTGHWWMKDPPALDWLNFQNGFVPTNNQHTTVQDIHAAPEDRKLFLDGWFVASMPDMNQRNPLVARYLIQNTLWWVEYADLAGIREDTYPYADPQFLKQWSKAVLDEYPRFNIVAEEMNSNPHIVAYWQRGANNRDGYDSGVPSMMDFPVADLMPSVLNDAETNESGLIKLYEMIANDFVYANPMNLVIFPDNHDRPRIFSQLHENLDLFKTSMLFTATIRGIPQIYYGTEVLTKSPIIRDDGLLRADMPGGWPGDKANAFSGAALTPAQHDAQNYVRKLLNWRKTNSAITAGKLMHYIPERGLYVYFRYGSEPAVMVVINKSKQDTELDLSRFQSMLKNRTSGKNVMTEEQVNLNTPLILKAMTSVAIELRK